MKRAITHWLKLTTEQKSINHFLKAILLVLIITTSMQKLQAQTLIASYPLATNLNDATGTYGAMVLDAGITYTSGSVCNAAAWLGSTTPVITAFTPTNFEINIDFQISSFATLNNIIVGGPGYRFIGILANTSGYIGYSYNNNTTKFSTKLISLNTWYTVKLQYSTNRVRLILDGVVIMDECCAALVTGGTSDQIFSTYNGGNGSNLRGCIRNLKIYNSHLPEH